MEPTTLIMIAGSGAILLTLAFSLSKNPYKKEETRLSHRVELIQKKIDEKLTELNAIQLRIDGLTFNHQQQLTNAEIKALEIYDKSNIRIPTDIIEDLHHQKLHDIEDILSFVETQRHYWRLENTKKPFKRKEV